MKKSNVLLLVSLLFVSPAWAADEASTRVRRRISRTFSASLSAWLASTMAYTGSSPSNQTEVLSSSALAFNPLAAARRTTGCPAPESRQWRNITLACPAPPSTSTAAAGGFGACTFIHSNSKPV